MTSNIQTISERDPAVGHGTWVDFGVRGGHTRTGKVMTVEKETVIVYVAGKIPGQELSAGRWLVSLVDGVITRIYSEEESLLMDLKYGI